MRDVPIRSAAELRADAIDMTGKRFGDWLVIRVAFRRYYDNGVCPQLYWWCRCLNCGHKAAVGGWALRRDGPGGTKQCFACSRLLTAEKSRAKSRRVGDGRTVARIAQVTGLRVDTVYHRLIRGWKPHELGMRPLQRGERRTSP